MSESRRQSFLSDVILAWMPFVAIFIAVPIAVYVPNQIEFEYKFSVLGVFLILGIAAIVPLLLLYCVRPHLRGRIAAGLFFIGLFILVSDIIAPLQWGEFNGDEKLTEPWRLTLLQAGLAAALVLLWLKISPRLVRAFGVPVVLTVLVFQGLALTHALPAASASTSGDAAEIAPAPSGSSLPNIYEFTFDAYSSLNFLDNLDATGLRAELDGFTFFPRTMANYPMTDASVPSFLTGRLFHGGSFKQFQLDAKRGGLRRALQDKGYRISIYSPDRSRFWMYDGASYTRTGQQLAEQMVGSPGAELLAQITLVRVMPNFLRREMRDATDLVFALIADSSPILPEQPTGKERPSYSYYKQLSVPLIRQFLADEKSRPASGQYVYLHAMLPHAPNVWSGACEATEKSNYQAQSLCSTRLMGEIVGELKRLGHYDNSIVIFQSDHGSRHRTADLSSSPFEMFSPEIGDEIEAVNNYYSAEGFFRRLHALLVIKPPMAGKALVQVSSAQAQLVDIAPTIYHLLGIAGLSTDGQSVFSLTDASPPREIKVFTGLSLRGEQKKEATLGRDLSEIDLASLGYLPGRGWRIYPSVHAEHEGW
jgi:hypothetical protein